MTPPKSTSTAAQWLRVTPIGATGAILIGTLLDELERQDKNIGLVPMCAASGMAPAIVIERVMLSV